MNRRIYLDHAATRFPKPGAVIDAMRNYSLHDEAAYGRGAYRSSQAASRMAESLRHEIATWVGCDRDREISFYAGGTEALNTALFGLIRSGDHVVTTAAEHNSVLRPLRHLETTRDVRCDLVPVDSQGRVSVDAVLAAVGKGTRVVAIVHGANVNGAIQPIDEIGRRLRTEFSAAEKPILLVDAAQTFGHLPLSVAESDIDALAAPGHKGGQGPLGTGFLYLRESLQDQIRPLIFGGIGTHSESVEMPTRYPDSFEAGNLNTPALAGWLAGLRARRGDRSAAETLQRSRDRMQGLALALYQRLDQIAGVRVIGKPDPIELPVASIEIEGLPAADAAMILDGEFGIEVRSGLHCAALIHEAIGSPADGTLRISCGDPTTLEELDQLASALQQLCAG